MMKKVLICLVTIMIIALTTSGVYAQEKQGSPKCNITISSTKVSMGKSATGRISCNAPNGLKDKTISPSDIIVNGGLIKKVKVTRVSSAYTEDNINYSWDFTLKGTFIGTADLSLSWSALRDNLGYNNATNNVTRVKVSLF